MLDQNQKSEVTGDKTLEGGLMIARHVPRFHVLAIVVGLLLPFSGTSFAAQKYDHPSGSKSTVKKNRGTPPHPNGPSSVPPFSPRGTSSYPFGPGVNFPYPDRPYGDPSRY